MRNSNEPTCAKASVGRHEMRNGAKSLRVPLCHLCVSVVNGDF